MYIEKSFEEQYQEYLETVKEEFGWLTPVSFEEFVKEEMEEK